MKKREAVVEGRFYPSTKTEIFAQIKEINDQSRYENISIDAQQVYGAVLPHAGHIYSGHQTVTFFKLLNQHKIRPDTLKKGFIVPGKKDVYTLKNEIILEPGDQLTFEPYEKHWFQAGPRGAVLYSFSTTVRDGLDGFTDPAIQRVTVVEE